MSDAPLPPATPPAPPAPVPAAPPTQTNPALPSGNTRKHLIILGVSCFAIVAAFCLEVQPDNDRVALMGTPEAKLPPMCFARSVLGLDCPGCGLTRSFIALTHGDFVGSFRFHRLGWLIFALALVQIPYRLHEIVRPAKSKALIIFAGWVGRVLIVLLLANWVGKLVEKVLG